MRLYFMILFVVALAQPAAADPTKLTLDQIFASGDFHGERVPSVKWLEDGGGAYTTLEPSKSRKGSNDIVRHNVMGQSEPLVAAEKLVPPSGQDPLSIESYELSKNLDLVLIYTNSAKVWRQNTRGDYWIYRRSTNKLKKLGGDAKPSSLMFAKISPDGSHVGYVLDNNLFIEPIDDGVPKKLTTDGSSEIINGTFDWVYEEEFFCRDGWRWSPDGKQIAYWQLDSRGVKAFTLADNISKNYPVLKTFAYPKTGERNSSCRIGVINVAKADSNVKWMDIPGDTRTDFYLPRVEWANNSAELVIRRVNRLQNAVDVMFANVETGKSRAVLTERDEAWVDIHDDSLTWIEKGNAFTWISERDGWRGLYLVSRDGNVTKRAIKADFDVIEVLRIDEKTDRVYYVASPDNPTQRYLYTSPLTGDGKPTRATPSGQSGWHDYEISPDGAFAIHNYSSFGQPPRVELISLPDHKVVRELAGNQKLRDKVDQLVKTPSEFFRVDIGDGVLLDGWLIKPADFDPSKKYPLMFHVYGEPAGQSVTDRWGGDQYLWHLMLAQQGYVVACFDNRGTPAPRGRSWRKSVYRRVGTLASEDQAAAARELMRVRPYLDSTRVGVWGWSGGGSMTLNLLFRYPDLYHTGMAVAPVPDMSLYDTIYQERYMGLPQVNAEDYKKGSPITHAEGLKGNLLVIHGSGDDNCHYQGTEKLVNKLIELNKSFTMMAYPNRTHSISEGANTTRHLYGLLTRYLKTNLPTGSSLSDGANSASKPRK